MTEQPQSGRFRSGPLNALLAISALAGAGAFFVTAAAGGVFLVAVLSGIATFLVVLVVIAAGFDIARTIGRQVTATTP